MRVLQRIWLPLVMVVVIAAGGTAVDQIRGIFGRDPVLVVPQNFAGDAERFNPKVVRYEVFGTPGAVVDINYLDLHAAPQRASQAVLPWSLTLSTTDPSASATLIAQGDADSLGCRVYVDDELRAERVVDGYNAQTYCIVKSA
ncbi:Siderophore export accessory protein MmpS5 [Mycolicibacterium vanbaalenii]|uniref:Siderophore export accessory protein MmpS5 n=1 Tax=Mycolicibacterium vanbaalenii TaxID=110539 RepID=A0A5S9QNI3_MYCVN|nr:MmpS family transport accessory protein [Mycolicibacterium vanbaalenii]CAA0119763.1 Siderophore export accessory protein MmpS5 [Mycolicibacterium vanbaalenii]